MAEDTAYNGWKNYETWAVGMYLDGNYTGEWTYRTTIETVQESLGGEHERYSVSHALKEMIVSETDEAINANQGVHPLVSDLFGAAMDSVDWYELADAWIQNVKEMIELEQA